ncbi:MAG: ferritin-like domain-containing protein [Chloroflexi bacterium]|nr:ferritin-like domain-containing protein [Chloroflexota bacterium]
MDVQRVIGLLNRCVSYEYSAVIQYLQHSMLVQGLDRQVFAEHFKKSSEESLGHAKRIGDKIVALGGVPAVEPAAIHQTTELHEMLEQNLAMEKEALASYQTALEAAQDDTALRLLLEEMVLTETEDVQELEKILQRRQLGVQTKEITFRRAAS